MRRCVAGLWRAWLCALLARCGVAYDGSVELVGSTSEAFPSCATYGSAYCAENGTKVMVVDASENFLIAYYKFDDGSGLDSSGKGIHATDPPPAGPGHSPIGSGARFDGERMMTIPHSELFTSSDLTVSFWMYLLEDSSNSYRTIFRKVSPPARRRHAAPQPDAAHSQPGTHRPPARSGRRPAPRI